MGNILLAQAFPTPSIEDLVDGMAGTMNENDKWLHTV